MVGNHHVCAPYALGRGSPVDPSADATLHNGLGGRCTSESGMVKHPAHDMKSGLWRGLLSTSDRDEITKHRLPALVAATTAVGD